MTKEKEKKTIGEIVGNGDIATVLREIELKPYLYFASGVSDSQETNEAEYEREKALLMSQDKSKHLVYFSSLCVFYSGTRYAQHKLSMERLIASFFTSYTIVRLGNIDWGKNPNTIINFLRNRYKNGEPIEIRDATRYVIGKEEFHHWIKLIPPWSCEMNFTGVPMRVSEIIKKYVL